MCCPGFEQKAWSQSKYDKLFECERKLFQTTINYNLILLRSIERQNSVYAYLGGEISQRF